ncbi:MAG TPA: hypothetical protein VM802_16490 [Chitinophaga sp.]|uniref:hypothetical protein n=1 Tax=Chitinophaga sp. TaxID=1869181 RepID=UPI002B68D50E|nr:hypothetical protein [Chitinophaga sp.]HVI46476.1 hypothetical protein [Chitinophaga sp.]
MENCTLYTHDIDMKKVLACIRAHFDESAITVKGQDNNWESVTTVSGKRFLRRGNSMTITFRQREVPGTALEEQSDDPVVTNLHNMYAYVQQLPAENEKLKGRLLEKITTINTEVAFLANPGFNGDFRAVIMEIALELDAIFFSEGNVIFRTDVQGFWDKTGALLLDVNGHSTATKLAVNVHPRYQMDVVM